MACCEGFDVHRTESVPFSGWDGRLIGGENHLRTWDGNSWKAKVLLGRSYRKTLSARCVTLPRICSITELIDDAVNGFRGTLQRVFCFLVHLGRGSLIVAYSYDIVYAVD